MNTEQPWGRLELKKALCTAAQPQLGHHRAELTSQAGREAQSLKVE